MKRKKNERNWNYKFGDRPSLGCFAPRVPRSTKRTPTWNPRRELLTTPGVSSRWDPGPGKDFRMLRHSRSRIFIIRRRSHESPIDMPFVARRTSGTPRGRSCDAWHDLTNGCFTSARKWSEHDELIFGLGGCVYSRGRTLSPPAETESEQGEHLTRKKREGREKSGEADVETSRVDRIGLGEIETKGNELKREDSRWGTNDWWERGKQERRHSYGREEHEPRGVTCQSSPRGNDSRSQGISMG